MFFDCLIATAAYIIIFFVIPAIIFAWMMTFTYNSIDEVYADMERARQNRAEKIAAFFGTQSQSAYNNQSNITDDAFLLFVGEQKLAFGHPEADKHITEEW